MYACVHMYIYTYLDIYMYSDTGHIHVLFGLLSKSRVKTLIDLKQLG